MTPRITGTGRPVGHGAADMSVRRATARDAKRLTGLIRSSSAYEGPYAPMIAGYRVGPDYIETHRVFLASAPDGRLLGFYALLLAPPELDLMFVADAAQGLGVGRRLINHMKEEARAAESTPYAWCRIRPPRVSTSASARNASVRWRRTRPRCCGTAPSWSSGSLPPTTLRPERSNTPPARIVDARTPPVRVGMWSDEMRSDPLTVFHQDVTLSHMTECRTLM